MRTTLTKLPARTRTTGAKATVLLVATFLTAVAGGFSSCKSDKSFFSQALLTPGPVSHPNVFNAIPARGVVKEFLAQFAYNVTDSLVYGHFSWLGNPGKLHDFYRYESGAWVRHGKGFRDIRKTTDIASAETRVLLGWNDPAGPGAIPNFRQFGCFLACHDSRMYMPDWAAEGAEAEITMGLPAGAFYSGSGMDMWHWRGHRSAPLGYWSDEKIDDTQPASGDARGKDSGTGTYSTNSLVGGNPAFVYDSSTTTSGKYAIPYSALATSPDYFFVDPSAVPSITGFSSPPLTMDWATATGAGYVPAEGDVIPRRILSAPTGSRGDILGVISSNGGTTVADATYYDTTEGRWHVYFTRAMDTLDATQDVIFTVGGQFEVGFGLHSDEAHSRDHYVSFPYVVWFEDPADSSGAAGADITARQITGANVTPDFSDTGMYPATLIELFLPGVTSWEYLTGSQPGPYLIGAMHGGWPWVSDGIAGFASVACRNCHVVSSSDPQGVSAFGGPMEERTPRRSGVFNATPASFHHTVKAALTNRCLPCHAAGGTAASVPFYGVLDSQLYANVIGGNRIDWAEPTESILLTYPAEDGDGNHPAAGNLVGFDGSADYNRILYWILFNAPNN